MGTKLALSYANLFMSNFEDKYVYPYPQQPFIWKRFFDKIFFIWIYSIEELDDLPYICHFTIKFTWGVNYSGTFLDLLIYKSSINLHTRYLY